MQPDVALRQREEEIRRYKAATDTESDDRDDDSDPIPATQTSEPGRTDPTKRTDDLKRRYFGSVVLDTDFPARDFQQIYEEILRHLSADGTLEIRLEVSAENPNGFSERTRRTVSENAPQLNFEASEFDER